MSRRIAFACLSIILLGQVVVGKKDDDGLSGNPFSWGGGDRGGGDSAGEFEEEFEESELLAKAHGVMATIAFAILFPLGAIIIRALSFRGLVWVHAAVQVFSYIVALAVMGLGIFIVMHESHFSFGMAHPTIGLVVICGLFVQPILGFLHHKLYASHGSPNIATRPHRWTGRILIVLGIINGGLGLRLARASHKWVIAYIVIAVFFAVVWFALIIRSWLKRGKKSEKTKVKTNVVHKSPRSRRVSSVDMVDTSSGVSSLTTRESTIMSREDRNKDAGRYA